MSARGRVRLIKTTLVLEATSLEFCATFPTQVPENPLPDETGKHSPTLREIPAEAKMTGTLWFWLVVMCLAVGIGLLCIGFAVMDDDDRSGLRFISYGAGVVIVSLAATLLR